MEHDGGHDTWGKAGSIQLPYDDCDLEHSVFDELGGGLEGGGLGGCVSSHWAAPRQCWLLRHRLPGCSSLPARLRARPQRAHMMARSLPPGVCFGLAVGLFFTD